ncbi:hypothetical protein HYP99_gp045 [Sinorhizobium phage ort11]|uniref:Uncharacterized protein n=1 Tax=Sinorhizobium phage ort11 TaxID=2599764 RepID=A0A5C2H6D8_9CAUD|nr:hypothetical protein HYP99_gp045 [Sinorhizobium phage ort11]QEP29843.1 hypothetical protein Smphiort11_045 [Sinorhizobium phage ort11]
MRELKFVNQDATPKTVVLHVATEAIPYIMSWYGGFFAGDDYKVFVDGKEISKDINGNLVGDTP